MVQPAQQLPCFAPGAAAEHLRRAPGNSVPSHLSAAEALLCFGTMPSIMADRAQVPGNFGHKATRWGQNGGHSVSGHPCKP